MLKAGAVNDKICHRLEGDTGEGRHTKNLKRRLGYNRAHWQGIHPWNPQAFGEWLKRYARAMGRVFFYAAIAALIGLVVGILDAVFGRGLIWLNACRDQHPLYFMPFLGVVGIAIMTVYLRFGGRAQRGMALIFAVGYEEDEHIPIRMIPLTVIATWLTHLFGGSAGREGVAVQIGATVANNIGNVLPIQVHPRVLVLAGMAAGFGGLFGTPMAGTFFALEVLVVGSIFYDALVPAIVAAWTADFTARTLGLQSFNLGHIEMLGIDFHLLVCLIGFGLAFGLVGRFFAIGLIKCRMVFADWIPNPVLRIFIIGTLLGIVFLALGSGRYSGLSNDLFYSAFTGGRVYPWDWALKLVLTVLTLSAGFQGGELAPCFVIGASLGVILGEAVGVTPALVAACGACSVFGAATRTFLAPVFLGVELFGPEALPYFFIVCVTAHVVAGQESIYVAQKDLSQLLSFKGSEHNSRL